MNDEDLLLSSCGIFDPKECVSGRELAEELMTNKQEPRQKPDELPDWLKKVNSIPPCKKCGIIVGGCLLEALGKECERGEDNE